MPEPVTYPFTQQRIEAQARLNVNVLILGSIAYAKAQGHGGRHWATFMGQALASPLCNAPRDVDVRAYAPHRPDCP
jgi:hypothetical protein